MNIRLRKPGLSIFLVCYAFLLQAQQPVLNILLLKGNDKVDSLNSWYFRAVRQYDSVHALNAINELDQFSRRSKDKCGIAAATYFKGQYLAVKLLDTTGISLMEEGIRLAGESGYPLQAAYYKHHFGYYCFSKEDSYSVTLRKMLEAHYVFKKIGYDKISEQAHYLYRLAFVYYHLGNYNGALEYLHNALRHRVQPEGFKTTLLNTIGQCYRNQYKYDSALHYFREAYLVAKQYNDIAWTGISSGSIGSLFILQRDFEKARPYCETYYSYSITAKDTICISESLTYLAEINLEQGRAGMALEQLNQATGYLQDMFSRELAKMGAISKENYVRQLNLFRVFARVYQEQQKDGLAFRYLQSANSVRDSLEKRGRLSGSVAIKQQLEAEQYLSNLALVEKEKQNTLLKQYFFIAALFLSVVILLLAYNRQKLKRRKDVELQQKKAALMEAEKRSVEAELRHAESLLDNYTDNLRLKTELLEQVQTEINALRHLHGDSQTPQVLYLNTLAKSTILTEQDWENFSKLFDKVHTGFFVRLREKYPNITPAETRLLSLTKLNLSTKEMAGMLGITTDAIKKTRQRLRKKMEVDEEKNLEELVAVL